MRGGVEDLGRDKIEIKIKVYFIQVNYIVNIGCR